MTELKALGSTVSIATNAIDPSVLEKFPSPLRQASSQDSLAISADRNVAQAGRVLITMERDEFTCLCPKTGQPDYGKIEIDYRPREWCVESKSLKLYLMTFRETGIFHESVAQRICDDLVTLLDPLSITVRFLAAPRGGIAFVPTASYHDKRKKFNSAPRCADTSE